MGCCGGGSKTPVRKWFDGLPATLTKDYEVSGDGNFVESNMKFYSVIEKSTGNLFTADFYYFENEEELEIAMAVDTLYRKIDHPNLPKLAMVLRGQNGKCVIFVRTKCEGGELFDLITKKEYLDERTAATYTRQLLLALQHMHLHETLHRNIKPESILLRDKTNKTVVLHPSFFVSIPGEFEGTTKPCGTFMYASPELLSKKVYSTGNDVWAVGVVVYIMMCGYPPFQGMSDRETMNIIIKQKLQFTKQYWEHVSDLAIEFLEQILRKNVARRLTVEDQKVC